MVEELTEHNDMGIEGVIYNELYEANKNIVDPNDLGDQTPGFVPVKPELMQSQEDENNGFVPLPQPHTEMIDIHQPTNWVELTTEENGFVPIERSHHIPTTKIDDSL